MLRTVLAVVVSFLALNLGVMVLFLVSVLTLGIEGTLRPGSYWTSTVFNMVVVIGGAVIALLSGALCGVIGRSVRPALVVAGAMLAFGMFGAVRNLNKADPPARPAPNAGESDSDYRMRVLKDMQTVGKEPTWFAFSVPVIGAGAVVLGAWLVARGTSGRK